MKTNLTTKTIMAIVLALFTFNSFAQKSVYVKLGGGYNFGTTAALDGASNDNTNGTVTSMERVKLAFGKGVNFGGTAGYMFNKYVGAELNISYLLGGTTQVKSSEMSSSSSNLFTIDYSAKMLSFIPSIVITPGFEKINPYARFGMIMGIPTVTGKMESSYTFGGNSSTSNSTIKLNGGLAVGFQSAIGIDCKINDKFSVFGELTSTNLTYSPKKGEVIESKLDGVDNLANLTTRDKKIEFVDSYSEDSSVMPDPNTSQKSIKPSLPFSSLGLNIGVVFHL
ncbi:MAG: hypothetical protein CFE21_14535 [Bacteroidetes bacterium B1(2017)]|nr:MAG: hypothetical protein CFE21_14535 [Bacteroidetes bacterium B1(2017)]